MSKRISKTYLRKSLEKAKRLGIIDRFRIKENLVTIERSKAARSRSPGKVEKKAPDTYRFSIEQCYYFLLGMKDGYRVVIGATVKHRR